MPTLNGNMTFRGVWDNGMNYVANDVVYYLSTLWVSLGLNSNQKPFPGSTYWVGSIDIPLMEEKNVWDGNDFIVISKENDGLTYKISLSSLLGSFTSQVFASITPTWSLVGGAGNVVPQYSTEDHWYARHSEWMFVKCFSRADGGNEGSGTGQLTFELPPTLINTSQMVGGVFPIGTAYNGSDKYILFGEVESGSNVLSIYYQTVVPQNSTFVLSYVPFTGAEQNNISRGISLGFFFFCGQN